MRPFGDRAGGAALVGAASQRQECQTRGLNFSFAIKATAPLLIVLEIQLLLWVPFTGRDAERRENYPEIMVLIMGWQVAGRSSRRLQMRSRNSKLAPRVQDHPHTLGLHRGCSAQGTG